MNELMYSLLNIGIKSLNDTLTVIVISPEDKVKRLTSRMVLVIWLFFFLCLSQATLQA
jgi:hypothetical protein